jgi:glycosyltransferase involved in cell wall biosynthesis
VSRRTSIRCLWLTWLEPWPAHDGQRIYSGHLIDALGEAGVAVKVLCFKYPGAGQPREAIGPVSWSFVPMRRRAPWQSAFSRLPNIAYRSFSPAMRAQLGELLAQRWDWIVMDSIAAGWALDPILNHYPTIRDRPQIAYVSHNHEAAIRIPIARNFEGNPIKKALLVRDAQKVAALERRLVANADVITAITPEDADGFRAARPDKPVVVLRPGYSGRCVPMRRITADVPRRAVLVGAFDWIAKQMNLAEFLAAATPVFKGGDVRLRIVGRGDEGFLRGLREQYPATEITGPVDDVFPYLDDARVAIVPERLGGGFKLKVLDYVFNRVPIAALDKSVAGMPLVCGDNMLSFADYESLARGVLEAMDDLDRLNVVQERAYAACSGAFDWAARGREMRAALEVA